MDKNEYEKVSGLAYREYCAYLRDKYGLSPSGFRSNQPWRQRCYDQVKDDIETYFLLLKRFKRTCNKLPQFEKKCLCTSFNEDFGYWSRRKNRKLFRKIARL